MSRYYLWDRTTDEIVPCGLAAYGRGFDIKDRRVAMTELPNGIKVYTTFLSADHNYGSGPPLVFETMAERNGEWFDYQERYSTAQEAREGHERAVLYFSQDPLPEKPE